MTIARLADALRVAILVVTAVPAAAGAQTPPGYPADYAQTVAAARQEGKVVVYSVLSTRAAQPLVKDFEALYPGIRVDYDGDLGSNETADRFTSELRDGKASADVMWSSAMDLQMRLVATGYSMQYRSPEAAKLPSWAVYDHRAWGTTFEPVVFVYNKDRLPAADVPRNHAAFARLLAEQAERLRGKVTAFDVEKSGVGYMFAVQDRLQWPQYGELLAAMGRASLQPSPGTGEMLRSIASGEYLLGYNIMGAYALVRSRTELPTLGVVIPNDYALVLSRVMFVSSRAAHPNAAKLWVDYVLSTRGQKVIGDQLELFAIRADVEGPNTAASLSRELGAAARPIPIRPEIAESLDPARQREFVERWKAALSTGERR